MTKAISCLNCGRPAVTTVDRRARKLLTCSRECEAAVRNGILREKRRLCHPELTCEGCGKAFQPKRAGATYCSPACRQRTYRQRARDDMVPSVIDHDIVSDLARCQKPVTRTKADASAPPSSPVYARAASQRS
jgi:hypothetical protein